MSMKDYIEEFYKLTMKSGHREFSKEKIARYVNGSRFNIQDEVGMMKIEYVVEAYQYALKAKDKLKRKGQVNYKGKEKLDNLAQAKLSAIEDEPKPVEYRTRTCRGEFNGKYYRCGEEGHRSFQCKKFGESIGGTSMVN